MCVSNLCQEFECPLCPLVWVLIPQSKQFRRENGWDKEPQEQEPRHRQEWHILCVLRKHHEKTHKTVVHLIGERERANLVVQPASIFYISGRWPLYETHINLCIITTHTHTTLHMAHSVFRSSESLSHAGPELSESHPQ